MFWQSLATSLLYRIRRAFRPAAKESGDDNSLDRELQSHLELEAEEQQQLGLSPEEARYAARRVLGIQH